MAVPWKDLRKNFRATYQMADESLEWPSLDQLGSILLSSSPTTLTGKPASKDPVFCPRKGDRVKWKAEGRTLTGSVVEYASLGKFKVDEEVHGGAGGAGRPVGVTLSKLRPVDPNPPTCELPDNNRKHREQYQCKSCRRKYFWCSKCPGWYSDKNFNTKDGQANHGKTADDHKLLPRQQVQHAQEDEAAAEQAHSPKRERDPDFADSVNTQKLEQEFYYCCRDRDNYPAPKDIVHALEKFHIGQSYAGESDHPVDLLGPVLWEKIKGYRHLDKQHHTWDTALHTACQHGHKDVAVWLEKYGMSLETRDGTGRHALHAACVGPYWRNAPVITWLCEKIGPQYMHLTDQFGNCALHEACRRNGTGEPFTKIVTLLLDELDFSLCAINENNETALHFASEKGNLPLLELLMDKAGRDGQISLACQESNFEHSNRGWPAAWYAQGNNPECYVYLQSKHELPPRPAAADMFSHSAKLPLEGVFTISDLCQEKCTKEQRIAISKFHRKKYTQLDTDFLKRGRVCIDEEDGKYHFSRAFSGQDDYDAVSCSIVEFFRRNEKGGGGGAGGTADGGRGGGVGGGTAFGEPEVQQQPMGAGEGIIV
jgi:hypothetical protein